VRPILLGWRNSEISANLAGNARNISIARLWLLGDVVLAVMNSLAEIERAADVLQTEEKKELVMFLLTRLRGEGGVLPPVRDIPKEQIEKWVSEDEAGYQRFLAGA
jgi:hypothetical protein